MRLEVFAAIKSDKIVSAIICVNSYQKPNLHSLMMETETGSETLVFHSRLTQLVTRNGTSN
jgi:hypothetical protein